MKTTNLLLIMVSIISLVLSSPGFPDDITVELDCRNYGEYGLVYYDPNNFPNYGVIHTTHGIPPRPDLRIGLRSDVFHRSYFVYDLSNIPQNAAVVSVRVKVEHEDHNYSDPNTPKLITIKGIGDYLDHHNLFTSILGSYDGWQTISIGYDHTFDDPQNDYIIQHLQSGISSSLYDWFGIRLQFGDESVNGDYWESKIVQMWVTYNVPYVITVQNSFGGGTFKVDGHTRSHGYQLEAHEGEQHTFESYDQTYNGKEYTTLNKWTNVATSQTYNQNPVTVSFNSNTTFRAEFGLGVIVKNRWDGGYVKVDNVQYSSGAEFGFVPGSTHDFEAWGQNYGGYDMVFKVGEEKWDTPDGPFYTALIDNHAVEQGGDYIAQLWRICNFTADINFLNGGSGGYLNVTGQGQQNVPYDTQKLEGESIEIEAPTQTKTVNGKQVTYNFLEWSDGNTSNPRTFAPTTHTQISAVMKGHLASNTADAVTLNNQRKMVWDDTYEKYHMVYEDNGEIYYTTTTGSDNAWVPEVLISDGGGGNKYPSIDVSNGIVVVVWQTDLGAYGLIQLRCKTASGWQNPHTVDLVFSNPVASTPVVAKGVENHIFLVVWHDYNFDKLSVRSYDWTNQNFGTRTNIPSTNSNSMYPSITSDLFFNQHLVWQESGKIFYREFDQYFDEHLDEQYEWHTGKEEVSYAAGYFASHVYPSITTNHSKRPNVSWQAWNGPFQIQCILHRRRESGGWGSVTNFTAQHEREYYKPNITGFPSVSNELCITWRRSDNKIWLAKYDGSSWDDFSQSVNGADPNLSANMSDDEVAKMVYRGTSSNPYILTTTSEGLIEEERLLKGAVARVEHHRCGILTSGQSEIVYELGEFEINGNPINLYPYIDTLIVGNTGKWEEMFRTEPFLVSDKSSLSHFRGFDVIDPNTLATILPKGIKIELRLEVVDAKSGKVITTPDLQTITGDLPSNSREFKNLLFDLGGNQEVFLRVGLDLPKGIPIKQSMVEVYYIEDVEGSFQKPFANENTTSSIEQDPSSFALGNNYPNPFNPVTTIAFDLPSNGYVNLDIYDISGRRVKTLVNKNMEAGKYHVVWDGHDEYGNEVASGTYFYRIKAGSFQNIKKMVLLR
jgi:hypothetical protein